MLTPTVTLKLEIPGAPDERLRVGLEAAASHFRKTGVHPMTAAAARFAREGAMTSDAVEYTEEDSKIAHVWEDAEQAAFAAVLGEGAESPSGAHLELVDPDSGIVQEDFEAAAVQTGEPPREGEAIYVGRDKWGDVAHFRWRTHPDLDLQDDDPYWAELGDDEPFEPVAWAPTTLSKDKLAELYE